MQTTKSEKFDIAFLMNTYLLLKTSYWVPSDKVQDGNVKTCINEQADGSCESIHIPECVDRTVKCSALPNPTGVEVC